MDTYTKPQFLDATNFTIFGSVALQKVKALVNAKNIQKIFFLTINKKDWFEWKGRIREISENLVTS